MPKIILYTPGSDTLFGPLTILDGQASPITLITYPTSVSSVHIEYTIMRNGNVQTGRLLVANNGTDATITDDNTNFSSLGIIFSGSVDGLGLHIMYNSSSTGFPATIKYFEKKWS